jgi:aldose 1-epimerase
MTGAAEVFGTAPDGGDVLRLRLARGGTRACVMTWGASLQDLRRDGTPHALVLGCPEFAPYLDELRYFGAIVGPLANRITGARFSLDGTVHQLQPNEGRRTTLHGGSEGFGQQNWRLEEASDHACTLALEHPAGRGGFPGNLSLRARYALEEDGALRLEITGTSDAPAVLGPAFHGYWNLDGGADLSGHLLQVEADRYLPVDYRRIPTWPEPVEGTPFDLRRPRPPPPQLDHNFCLAEARGPLRRVARLQAGSLRLLLETTEPGLQVYAGGQLGGGAAPGHHGRPHGANAGLALEPQPWPDAPNRMLFPSARIDVGETYRQITRFSFDSPS